MCSVMSSSFRPHSLPGFSVHGISQAGILEWVAISYSNPTGVHLFLKKVFFSICLKKKFFLASIKAHLCELTALYSCVVFFCSEITYHIEKKPLKWKIIVYMIGYKLNSAFTFLSYIFISVKGNRSI